MDRKENQQKNVRIELTEEQRQKIQQQTGKDAAAVEFSAEELEDRIAPSAFDLNAL